ncbi:hypothetical protein LEP1GSC137_2405 [Leptospira borgpetersenii str. Noumea 25]|uniref:Uncharacterized protein n=2 Tax=Leptospira borgpetersenii TaxID=174 RepID=A0A0S2IUE3_LEPBO|nr:hypothetical protein LBBP_03064 [Leptospira borgpetersenii serovar Ballum]EKQ99555.1 hypothetical protein LEP1GSC121_2228 [Leptospira borgpetersenii serovar Castellonis str. 200801910]EMN18989.1 hypothetical protein LEP1GSC056_1773 [Leptospira borgpetersenii str. Brem 328]EMO09699.1 hypothetical protein LEP1GSC137_2405 [Leptospira borgpetersenii str. Noumea 25]
MAERFGRFFTNLQSNFDSFEKNPIFLDLDLCLKLCYT